MLTVSQDSYAAKFTKGRPWTGMASKETTRTIHELLKQCDTQHPSCRRRMMGDTALSSPPLPTRLLFVGTVDKPELRLKITAGEHGRYLALSHCWGEVLEAKTTKQTFESHLRQIKEAGMSVLLRDSTAICRMLGYSYLWVDSLCTYSDRSSIKNLRNLRPFIQHHEEPNRVPRSTGNHDPHLTGDLSNALPPLFAPEALSYPSSNFPSPCEKLWLTWKLRATSDHKSRLTFCFGLASISAGFQ